MKNIFVLLWVVFLSITPLLAQSEADKQEAYDQLNEWVVVKLTLAFMEDLYSFTPEEKGVNGNNKEYSTYKQLYDDYSAFKEGIDLDEISEVLKNGNWKSANRVEFFNYRNELIRSSTHSDFSFIKYKPINTLGFLNREKALNEIIDKFEEILKTKKPVEKITKIKEKETTVPSDTVQTTQPRNNSANNSSYLSFILLGVLLICIGVMFYLFRKVKNLNETILKFKEITSKQPKRNIFDSEFNDLILEKKSLITTIQFQKEEIESLRNTNNIFIPSESSTKEDEIITPPNTFDLEVPNNNNLIYLSSPFQNLTFANEDASKDKTLNSLYFVEFNEQNQTGELSILTDSNLSKALNSPDIYLETACIYDNEYSNNAKAIVLVEKGEIKLDCKDWIVTKKVRIKFI